jgi:hypothetical protein
MIVKIDPACDALYSFYYLEGLKMLAGVKEVIFDATLFSPFKHTRDYLPMVVESNAGVKKNIIIDFGDTKTFRPQVYEWADVYAKVNLMPEDFESHPKMMPLGPGSLGIKFYPTSVSVMLAAKNFLRARKRIPDATHFFSSYKACLRRLSFNEYDAPLSSSKDYVHFVSTLWKDDKVANDFRVNFMQAVKELRSLSFEGGFAPRADGWSLGYEDHIGPAFESLQTYREKIGRSFVVFNTPAVKQCHGWKLPEFLAWGKAIISTPPVRMFPEPLVDGVHWLLTDGTVDDITAKIRMLQDDPSLHAELERNARAYFEKYLHPESVMRRIVERAGFSI